MINPALLSSHWNASWITYPTESVYDYGVYHFRKTFELKEKSGAFIINISADNRYRLFVNGTPVCFGPARSDLKHWFFETVDIASFLITGKNVIAVLVWNAGEKKPWAQISLQTGLIVQGNGKTEEIVNTDRSWRVIKDVAYSPASAGSEETNSQFIVVGPCEKVNGELYPWSWEMPEFDDSQWYKPKIYDIGQPYGVGTDIRWVLTPRRIPMMELKRERPESVRRFQNCTIPTGFPKEKKQVIIPSHQKASILLDQGVLTTGYPELITSGGKGSAIKLSYAEALYDKNGQKGNRNDIEGKTLLGYSDYFLPDGEENRLFRPLWFRTWRYILLEIETGNQQLVIEDLSSEFSAYPLKEIASFESDNETLKKIWETGWRTARLCANETYFDCPYYEQLQYIGDTRIQAMISLYVSGDDRLVRNALLQFDESRLPEGITHSRYPTSMSQFIPTFSLYWIDMVHDYFMLRDDQEFIRSFLPGIDQVMIWYVKYIDKESGLLGKVPYWNFVDWAVEWPWSNEKRIGGVPSGGTDGGSSLLTMQLAYAADRASELFRYFGHLSRADYFSDLAASLKKAVYLKCWDSDKNYLSETPGDKEFSMHSQIFGILTNTIPEDKQREVAERILKDNSIIQPTMYFRAYLAQALKKTLLSDHYVESLGLWETMLKNGLTTFAENPDPTRSDCHAWSASPNYDMLATIAGIRPAESGFKSVIIEPALGELNFIKGAMPHPSGMILFDLKKTSDKGISGTITLPEGLKGIFRWNGKETNLTGRTAINL